MDNAWFPLPAGAKWTYRGEKDGIASHEVVTVTGETKTIQGVRCTLVHDVLDQKGHVAERTNNYYAQDTDGTVWYFGEDTAELNAKGEVTSTEGTWQSGKNGAHAGIFMTANPQVGESYRQEYLKGEAEDPVRAAISKRSTTKELQDLAVAQGMVSILNDGLACARKGETSLSEVLRVAG